MDLIKEFLSLESVKKFCTEKNEGKAIESYLFYSPDSFSNKNYALAIALSIICKNTSCLTCLDCVKILEGVHPDVLSFPEGKRLSVDDSKKIVLETTKKPMLADSKVIIINDIDNSSDEAQNKLLKIIEEPPKNVIFIATATNLDKVLATIKSRMQKRKIEKFEKTKVEQILQGVDSASKQLAISKGSGYIGKTLQILEDEQYVYCYRKAKEFVFEIKTTADILRFCGDKNLTRETLSLIITHMSSFFGDLMIYKADFYEGLENNTEITCYNSVASEFSIKALKEIQKLLIEAVKKIQANGNPGLILETLLVKILEVKYLCK